jgi:Uma2 family endonuclease
MSTAIETPPLSAQGERRFLIRGIGWQGYQTLLELVRNLPIRITYDRGDAELMSPLFKHERGRSRLSHVVEILAEELRIPMVVAGSTTLNREDLDRGLEADASYYLGNLHRLSDFDDLDLEMVPPPDLAIEIEITRSVLPRLGIYGALGVPEIWRFDGSQLRILSRESDGSYREVPRSMALPWISIEEIQKIVGEPEPPDDSLWLRNFRIFVRETIVPRVNAVDGGE